jgi:hypothetical protein
MSGEQRKRSASKKSARAMAKSHRRQADYSYDAMLEAQDDAWEGGEYQGHYAYENPFVVTPGGQAVGSHELSRYEKRQLDIADHPRVSRRFDAEIARKAARGASILEREGIRLNIKKVGNEYRIYDDRGNDLHKFAYSLEKAQDIIEKMMASQR